MPEPSGPRSGRVVAVSYPYPTVSPPCQAWVLLRATGSQVPGVNEAPGDTPGPRREVRQMASSNISTGPTERERRTGPEIRSIDYVPLNERHGKLWHLGPLWFMSNAQIATLAVGVLGVTTGGNLIWSLLAVLLGVLTGTFFMAAHSAQGPQLGLPQMIQSRPQFGYMGALLVWLFAYLQYAGFNIFNTLLAADAMHATVHGSTKLWLVVGTGVALVAAVAGYDFIHRMERGLAYGFLVIFGILSVIVFTLHYPAGSFDL